MATMTEAEKKAAADKEAAEQKAAAEKKAAAFDKQAAEKAAFDKQAAAEKAAFDKQADEEAKKGDGSVSAAEQKKIDEMLGDESEGDDDERSVASAKPEGNGDPEFISVFRKLVAGIPDDTPDDYILYGAAGHVLRMGHLRAAVKHY